MEKTNRRQQLAQSIAEFLMSEMGAGKLKLENNFFFNLLQES